MKEVLKLLAAAYDKLVLFCVLLGLMVSFLLLNILVDREQTNLAAVRAEGPSGPTHPVGELDIARLEQGMKDLAEPFQVSAWTNRVMVPEVRTRCVVCGRPIPYEAEICPFRNCLERQPTVSDDRQKDSDGDGIPDWWELEHGFDPFNPDDASEDADGDGFTNLEAYIWDADPRDPECSPPPAAALRLLRVGRLPMPLSFQGVSRTADSVMIFTLRHRTRFQDYHVRMGDVVEGYELVDYEHKTLDARRPGMPVMKQDVSTLTLRKDDRDYVLTYRTERRGELAANIYFRIDKSEFTVTIGDEIDLEKNRYKVVDIASDAVIVEDIDTGMEIYIDAQLSQPVEGRDAIVEKRDE